MTVNVVSWFGKEQNDLVSQSNLFDTILRHSIEISDDHPNAKIYLPSPINNDFEFHYRWAELVTLALGLRPERLFAPLACGLVQARNPIYESDK